MKAHTRIIALSLLILLSLPLAAAPGGPIRVDYLSGTAELRVGEAWRELSIGEVLPSGPALVRTAEKTILQLSRAGSRLSLSTKGSWDLEALFASKAGGGAQSLARRLMEAVKGRRGQSTAMGVRSAEAQAPALLFGLYAEAEQALSRGEEAFLSDDMGEADAALSEALEIYSWTEGEEPALASRIAFWNAALLSSQDRGGEALATLESQDWRLSGELSGQYLILQARLSLESLAPERARELSSQALDLAQAAGLSPEEEESLKAILAEAEAALGPAQAPSPAPSEES